MVFPQKITDLKTMMRPCTNMSRSQCIHKFCLDILKNKTTDGVTVLLVLACLISHLSPPVTEGNPLTLGSISVPFSPARQSCTSRPRFHQRTQSSASSHAYEDETSRSMPRGMERELSSSWASPHRALWWITLCGRGCARHSKHLHTVNPFTASHELHDQQSHEEHKCTT